MGKIEAVKLLGKKIADTFRTQTISSENKSIFSFAKKHPLKNARGQLREDGMILTHLTDYLPKDGYIDTARSAIGASRDSVHFAVNHGVTAHLGGDWSAKKYAILIPMRNARRLKKNKFMGGVAGDFYSHGKVRIPRGSVIVKRTDNVKPGKYRISDSSKIDEFKDLHGVKVIETRNSDMKETVDDIVQKLGYDFKNADEAFYWGDGNDSSSFRDFAQFNKFLKKKKMAPAFHSYTPNAKVEMIIENINLRTKLNRGWQFSRDGKLHVDAKKDMLNALKYIEHYSKSNGLPLDFDTKTLAGIIEKSKTPKEAANMLKQEMNIFSNMLKPDCIKMLKKCNDSEKEFALLMRFKMLIDSPVVRKSDSDLNKYLLSPNNEALEKIQEENMKYQFDLFSELGTKFEKYT